MAANQLVPATGGAIDCDIVDGRVQPLRAAIQVWDRPGLDGHGARSLGTRSPESRLRVVKFVTSYTNGKTFETSVRNLVGQYITVNYEVSGQTASNVLVLSVDPAVGGDAVRAALNGAANTYMVELLLTVQQF